MRNFNVITQKLNQDMLIIGDVHGNIDAFNNAVDYAQSNGLTILSLGDIVDYGQHSAEVFVKARDLVQNDKMIMIGGNHEFKIYRYLNSIIQDKKSSIIMEDKHMLTIDGFDNLNIAYSDVVDFFHSLPQMRQGVINDRRYVFAHASVHRSFWNYPTTDDIPDKQKKVIVAGAYYGETDGVLADGFPNRTYKWVDHIPMNTTVFIGHDVVDDVTYHDDKMIQLDTGSSKGGFLSGFDLKNDQSVKF